MLLKVKPIITRDADKKETNRIRRVLIPSRTTVEEPSCLRALLEALLGLEKLIAATGGLFLQCFVLSRREAEKNVLAKRFKCGLSNSSAPFFRPRSVNVTRKNAR
jgi:hypothetical protein